MRLARRIGRGECVSSSHERLIAPRHCPTFLDCCPCPSHRLPLTPVDCCAPSRAPRPASTPRPTTPHTQPSPRKQRLHLAPAPARPRSTVSSRPSLPLRFCRSRPALAQSPRLHVQGNVLSSLRPMLNGLCEVEDPAGHPLLVCADPAREFPTRLHGIVSIEH